MSNFKYLEGVVNKLILVLVSFALSGCSTAVYTPPSATYPSTYPEKRHEESSRWTKPEHSWDNDRDRLHDRNTWDDRDNRNNGGDRDDRNARYNQNNTRGKPISVVVIDSYGDHDSPYSNPGMNDTTVNQADYTNDVLHLLRSALNTKGYSPDRRGSVQLQVKITKFSFSSFGSKTNVRADLWVSAHNNQGDYFQHEYEAHHKDSGPSQDQVIRQTLADAINELMRDPRFLALLEKDTGSPQQNDRRK